LSEKSPQTLAGGCVVRSGQERGPFRHPLNPLSEVYGAMLGRQTGLTRTGVNRVRLPPGRESFAPHLHQAEEEWLYVIAGAGTLEIGGQSFPVGPGDFAGFPPGTWAHHVRNTGAVDLAYLSGGENKDVEVGDFPREGLRLVRLRSESTLYRIAEGRPLGPREPRAPQRWAPKELLLRAAEVPRAPELHFTHKLNPRSGLHSRGLGEQVGFERIAVNAARLAPGKESYVFHRHAIEEEWMFVLSGRALIEIGEEKVELAAGDFAGFPPSAPPHLLTNPFAEEVRYLEGGELLGVDVVDFPRLGQRIVRIGDQRTLYRDAAGEPFTHAPPG
jgi:uncharacterized cupin superfamily protein